MLYLTAFQKYSWYNKINLYLGFEVAFKILFCVLYICTPKKLKFLHKFQKYQ